MCEQHSWQAVTHTGSRTAGTRYVSPRTSRVPVVFFSFSFIGFLAAVDTNLEPAREIHTSEKIYDGNLIYECALRWYIQYR